MLEKLYIDEFFWKEVTRPVTYVYEGLIYTYPLESTLGILKRSEDVEQREIFVVKDRNSFKIEITGRSKDSIDKLNKKAEVCGWVPSDYFAGPMRFLPNNLNGALQQRGVPIWVTYEAKYDMEVGDFPHELYHSTPLKNLANIQKVGLSPRGDQPRIYLALKPEDAEAVSRAKYKNLSNKDKANESIYVTLKIVISDDNIFRLFKDPQYLNKGYYTLNNIRHNSISVFRKIDLADSK